MVGRRHRRIRQGVERRLYTFNAVSGDPMSDQVTPSGAVCIFDESCDAYRVTTADVNQPHGVIHVVEGVLLSM